MKCHYCASPALKGSLCPACIHGLEMYYENQEAFEARCADRRQKPPVLPSHDVSIVAPIIETCAAFGLCSVAELVSPTRTLKLSRPRMAAAYLIRKHTGLALVDIGKLLGNRDHSTIGHAIKRGERDVWVARIVKDVSERLNLEQV